MTQLARRWGLAHPPRLAKEALALAVAQSRLALSHPTSVDFSMAVLDLRRASPSDWVWVLLAPVFLDIPPWG